MSYARTGLLAILLLFITQPVLADSPQADDAVDQFKEYLNTMATDVKRANDPAQKRAIMNERLERMQNAIKSVKTTTDVSAEDREGLQALYANIDDKLAQLNGQNGYEQVPAEELNEFADYVQQDLEQAQRLTITLGVTTLLLIIIILLLI